MSNLTEWSERYSTGVYWQDYQHRELIKAINALHVSLTQEVNQDKISQLIDFLDFYVKDHFGIEKGYMEMLNYPGTEQHLQEHAIFIDNLEELKNYRNLSLDISPGNLCEQLNQWIINHIGTSDKVLGEFFDTQNIS